VAREPALDLQVIEEQIDRLVELQPARHGSLGRVAQPRATSYEGCSCQGVRP
jgi:hypothetical protein